MIFLVDDLLVEEKEKHGNWSGTIPVTPPKTTGRLRWSGPKISARQIEQTKAFLLWAYKTHGGEAVVRFACNQAKGKWIVVPLPQYASSGLHVDEIEESPARKSIITAITGKGFAIAGSAHSHCAASAFQSSTDEGDEQSTPGIHITWGSMDHATDWTFHARCYLRRLFVDAVPEDWFEKPAVLTKPPAANQKFPESWKKHVEKRPVPPAQKWESTGYAAGFATPQPYLGTAVRGDTNDDTWWRGDYEGGLYPREGGLSTIVQPALLGPVEEVKVQGTCTAKETANAYVDMYLKMGYVTYARPDLLPKYTEVQMSIFDKRMKTEKGEYMLFKEVEDFVNAVCLALFGFRASGDFLRQMIFRLDDERTMFSLMPLVHIPCSPGHTTVKGGAGYMMVPLEMLLLSQLCLSQLYGQLGIRSGLWRYGWKAAELMAIIQDRYEDNAIIDITAKYEERDEGLDAECIRQMIEQSTIEFAELVFPMPTHKTSGSDATLLDLAIFKDCPF